MSLKKQSNGKFLLTIYLKSGGRMRLVGYSDRRASLRLEENIKTLDACNVANERPDRELMDWLENLPDRIKQKLVKHRLLSQSQLEKSKTLIIHLEDYIERQYAQVAKGMLKEDRVKKQRTRLSRLIKDCSLTNLSDLDGHVVDKWIADKYNTGKLSAKTCNDYLHEIKQFCKWLNDSGRNSVNPVSLLKPINITSENTTFERRVLSDDEIAQLITTTRDSKSIRGKMSGYKRSLVYEIAIFCGLRFTEIKTLIRSDIDLEQWTITCRDVNSKNSKTESLPLCDELAFEFAEYFKVNPFLPTAKIFNDMPREGYKMLKGDLAEAGIEYINDDGKCDFHSLRHTYCTRLARAGLQPQIVMKLARHSSIDLTMKHYTHFSLQDKSEAIQKVPEIEFVKQRHVSTGTNTLVESVDNFSGEKRAISAYSGNNRTDCTGHTVFRNSKSVIGVSDCDIKKNTAKGSVLGNINNIDLNDTDWCRGGDLNPHTREDKRF